MSTAETRQQFFPLGEEFLNGLCEHKAKSKRSSTASADLGPQLAAMLHALLQITERLGRIEERLEQLHETSRPPEPAKEYYTTQEAAKILGKRPYTVREWCRLERVHAQKALSGRGIDEEWRISREEIERIQNEGLLPMKQPASFRAHARLPR